MRTAAYVFGAALVLGGCATQEPATIVDAACESASCQGQVAAIQKQARVTSAELDASKSARAEAEACCREKAAVAQQLQSALADRSRAEQALSERGAELARCQGELAAQQVKAKADGAACDAVRAELLKHAKAAEEKARKSQRLRELEQGLRKRLQNEIGSRDVEIEQLRSHLMVRVLDRILFNTGSAEILPRGREVLDMVAAALAEGDETIRIEGHADIVPIGPLLKSKYYSNWELSAGRASSVARYFQHNHGLEPARMEAVGFSKYRPIAPNDTEENRQRNRRVEIVLTPWKAMQEGAEVPEVPAAP